MSAETTGSLSPRDALDAASAQSAAGGTSGPFGRLAVELQRRKVCRAAFSYSVLVWLNVQIADVVFPMAGLPEWSLRLVVIIGLLGLPLVVFLAWTFQITPHGLRIDSGGEVSRVQEASPRGRTELAVNLLLLGLGLALAGWLMAQRAIGDDGQLPGVHGVSAGQEARLALAVHAAEGDAVATTLRRSLEAGVREALIQLPYVTVVADATLGAAEADAALSLLVSGHVTVDGGRVHAVFDALDVRSGRYVWARRLSLTGGSLLDVERTLTDRVVEEIKALLGIDHGDASTRQDIVPASYDGLVA